jgi:hypothetical protein
MPARKVRTPGSYSLTDSDRKLKKRRNNQGSVKKKKVGRPAAKSSLKKGTERKNNYRYIPYGSILFLYRYSRKSLSLKFSFPQKFSIFFAKIFATTKVFVKTI